MYRKYIFNNHTTVDSNPYSTATGSSGPFTPKEINPTTIINGFLGKEFGGLTFDEIKEALIKIYPERFLWIINDKKFITDALYNYLC